MNGVEHRTAPDGSNPGPQPEPAADRWSPAPWRPWWARVTGRLGDPLRPWITWFGPGRLVAGGLTIVVVVGVGWWLLRPATPPTEARLPYAGTTVAAPGGSVVPAAASATPPPPASSSPVAPAVVIVHIAGAVAVPGVVELPVGSRVGDGVAQAGGATADADVSAVNLAAVLQDGEQVYVPRVGEAPPPVAPRPGDAPGAGSMTPVGPIDVNQATVAELDTLPGVGPSTAAAIVAHRETQGPFASVDDLDAVRGIGPAKLDALRDLVTT